MTGGMKEAVIIFLLPFIGLFFVDVRGDNIVVTSFASEYPPLVITLFYCLRLYASSKKSGTKI